MRTAGARGVKKRIDNDDLESLPGIGKSLAADLRDLGCRRARDLAAMDPEAMYEELQEIRGAHIDRCVLYAFRCAVYCARNEDPHPELRKWWNWKDRGNSRRRK